MDYLRKKYQGFETVLATSLQDELLLSEGEFMLIKKEVAAALGKNRCPLEISVDLFNDMVDLYL